jgi:hypothetical protein
LARAGWWQCQSPPTLSLDHPAIARTRAHLHLSKQPVVSRGFSGQGTHLPGHRWRASRQSVRLLSHGSHRPARLRNTLAWTLHRCRVARSLGWCIRLAMAGNKMGGPLIGTAQGLTNTSSLGKPSPSDLHRIQGMNEKSDCVRLAREVPTSVIVLFASSVITTSPSFCTIAF